MPPTVLSELGAKGSRFASGRPAGNQGCAGYTKFCNQFVIESCLLVNVIDFPLLPVGHHKIPYALPYTVGNSLPDHLVIQERVQFFWPQQ